MKKFVQIFSTAALFLIASPLFSQDLTGIWRGYFITEYGDQYRYEVQLDQSKKNGLSGVTYSYLDTRFYGKATFVGNYTKGSSAALVQETKTIEVKMAGGSVACIMKCRLVYTKSGREEFLEGEYTSVYEKTDPSYGALRGASCGGGKVFLRKVPTSDFYVEPFLRNKKKTIEELKKDTLTTRSKPKIPTRTQTTLKESRLKKDAVKKPIENSVIVQPEKKPDVTTSIKPVMPRIVNMPITIRDRKNELIKTITVNNSDIEISLYDNGEIDDDTVSLYVDGLSALAKQRLSSKPITYKLHLDESNPDHYLAMVAENLGRIPPNTSLMVVQDGDKRYQVSITSTMQKNAMIRFRYEKKE